MPTQLRLQPYQLADLREIRDLDRGRLQAIIDRLRGMQPSPMQPSELHREITAVLEGNSEVANRILRPLLSLRGIIKQRNLTADDIIEGVRYGIESSEPGWEPAEIDRWRSVEPLLKDLLLLPAVRLVATALDVSYEYANLLQGARVITDIRPVFSEDAEQIEGAVISHTLRIRYDSTEGNHSLSIAMDESDIRELEKQCQRALKKAETAKTLMVDRARVPTIISGDSARGQA